MNNEKICKLITIINKAFENKDYKKLSAIGLYLDIELFKRIENKDILYTLFKNIDSNKNIHILKDNVSINKYNDLKKLLNN